MEYMTIEEIMARRKQLDTELNHALSTMERKSTIMEIRQQIIDNQKQCPHFSEKYNLGYQNGACPYCGFQIEINNNN